MYIYNNGDDADDGNEHDDNRYKSVDVRPLPVLHDVMISRHT